MCERFPELSVGEEDSHAEGWFRAIIRMLVRLPHTLSWASVCGRKRSLGESNTSLSALGFTRASEESVQCENVLDFGMSSNWRFGLGFAPGG